MSGVARSEGLNPARRIRELVTPEGVDLNLVLAEASERATAFLLDVVFIVLALVAMTIGLSILAAMLHFAAAAYLAALWVLGFFFIRLFYFTAFEMGARAATPAKRMLGLRVVARSGGPLTANAIFARNAMRELEVFLPLTFVATKSDSVDLWISVFGLVWSGVFVFFPLFNRDRLRIGDIVAGTWVVHTPRRILGIDLAAGTPAAQLVFDRTALEAYGIRELSVLESVLRAKEPGTMREVADRIRRKIGRTGDATPDAEFLSAYYVALRRHLESRLLLGRRKRDKFDTT